MVSFIYVLLNQTGIVDFAILNYLHFQSLFGCFNLIIELIAIVKYLVNLLHVIRCFIEALKGEDQR